MPDSVESPAPVSTTTLPPATSSARRERSSPTAAPFTARVTSASITRPAPCRVIPTGRIKRPLSTSEVGAFGPFDASGAASGSGATTRGWSPAAEEQPLGGVLQGAPNHRGVGDLRVRRHQRRIDADQARRPLADDVVGHEVAVTLEDALLVAGKRVEVGADRVDEVDGLRWIALRHNVAQRPRRAGHDASG